MNSLGENDKEQEEKRSHPPLDWKDYVAIIIATLETKLLPVILLVLAIFLLTMILRFVP